MDSHIASDIFMDKIFLLFKNNFISFSVNLIWDEFFKFKMIFFSGSNKLYSNNDIIFNILSQSHFI